jgi:sucrose-6-phosphate hydrolase SacC (GH32 family)
MMGLKMNLQNVKYLGILFLLLLIAGCASGDNQPDTQKKDDVLDMSHIRDKILKDKQRPTYHFVMPEGIAEPFDPNGAIYWNGRYHLFYIFQPKSASIWDSYWGHVSSTDLLHWRYHPTALSPSPDGPDKGIFSGNAFVNKDGQATILYHGVKAGNCIATSSDPDLNYWQKLPSNPIVRSPEKGDPNYGKYQSWDPHGWLDGDTYYAIFGGKPATLFTSSNLKDWNYIGDFFANDMPDVEPFEDLSCPDFFKLGDKYMLLGISHSIGCRYYLGDYKDNKFYPEIHQRMNWGGGACFAPESMVDPQGRRIMWAWAIDSRFKWENHKEIIENVGWSGTMTLPRVLSLGADGALRIQPIEELKTLRSNHRELKNISVVANTELKLQDIRGDCFELDMIIIPGEASEFGVKIRCSPNGEEETIISYDVNKKSIIIDVAKSTLNPNITYENYIFRDKGREKITRQVAPFEINSGEKVNFHIFSDRSIVEVFVNDRICVTQRIYPTRDDSQGIILFTKGGDVNLPELNAWKMQPANPW